MKQLKNFQEEAKDEIVNYSTQFIRDAKKEKLIVFQSPTGSGKTFVLSKYIEEMFQWSSDSLVNEDLVFLWLTIGKGELEEQSYRSLSNDIAGGVRICTLEEVERENSLNDGIVIVLNWEKINKKNKDGHWKNKAMKRDDYGSLIDCLEATRESGAKIVLIIDESHASAQAARAMELRSEVLKPYLTIEASATPVLTDPMTHMVKVEAARTIDEGMIKKEIIINADIKDGDTETSLMKSSILKRDELRNAYIDEGTKINPLCLIQLPSGDAGDKIKETVEKFLAKNEITTENGKLAIHLSIEKKHQEIEELAKDDNKVEFLIFKQAIDTGWDCPRAQILVKFRDKGKTEFELQVLGRILRMAEQKHYKNEIINRAYVYTNDIKYEIIKEEYNPNIIKKTGEKRKKIYEDMGLNSYYQYRTDFGDIGSDLYTTSLKRIFSKSIGKTKDDAKSKNISLRKNVKKGELLDKVVIDSREIDALSGKQSLHNSNTITRDYSENDLNRAFDLLVRSNLQGFTMVKSMPIVRGAIKRYFTECIKIEMKDGGLQHIQNICLNNYKKIENALEKAIADYKRKKEKETAGEDANLGTYNTWEIPDIMSYNPHIYKEFNLTKNIHRKPCLSIQSAIEEDFARYLDKCQKIKWWWMNGSEHTKENFGIKYEDKNKKARTFQPDFIVQFKDKKIGIFDTKSVNRDVDDVKLKAEALQKYITEEKERGKKLIGGIVINIVKDNVSFRMNDNSKYKSYIESEDNWKPLNF